MALTSTPDNIRYNGTGRAYVSDVASTNPGYLLGELENLNFSLKVSTEQLRSTQNAARAVILERETERTAELSFGLREQSEENLKMALLAGQINTQNQTAGTVYQATKTWPSDLYLDVGHINVFSTKVTGAITGTLAIGDTVTGDVSTKTGKVAFVGSGYVELVQVTGSFTGDTKLSKDAENYIAPSGIEVLEDLVIVSADGNTRRAQGTDYTLDPDYGYVRKLSTGSITDSDEISYDYEAVNKKYLWGLSAGSVTKRFIFVSDKDDQGPRHRWIFHKVNIMLNGDMPLIGEKAAILSIKGTVLADTSQPSGQEYYKVEVM